MRYIIAVDQGTTGTRAVLFDEGLSAVEASYREHRQLIPKPGWAEHDPEELVAHVHKVIRSVVAAGAARGIKAKDIACLGIDNQGETVVAWDRETGKPLYNAVVWHCRRSDGIARRYRQDQALESYVRQNTGLTIDSYFSATKYRWLLENVPAVQAARATGRLCLGTLDSYLIYRLGGGRRFVTDYATASRTMLLNIHTLGWDQRLLKAFDIRREELGELIENAQAVCATDQEALAGLEIPITGSIVDQQAALLGQSCFERGSLKATYGTGCFVLMNAGESPVFSNNGLNTTIGWRMGGETRYALEGGVYIAGAALKWLRDKLGLFEKYGDIDGYASSLPGNEGVYFVPAFSGFGAPRWDATATGMLIGVTLGTTKAHIIRATLEGIGYQVNDLIRAMEAAAGEISMIKADGGISQSRFMMQFQADLAGKEVKCAADCEATARGTAMIAGLGAGIFRNLEQLKGLEGPGIAYHPQKDAQTVGRLLDGWEKAVQRASHWTGC